MVHKLTNGLSFHEAHPVQLLTICCSQVGQHVVHDALALLAVEKGALLQRSLKAILVLQYKLLHAPAILPFQRLADPQLLRPLQQAVGDNNQSWTICKLSVLPTNRYSYTTVLFSHTHTHTHTHTHAKHVEWTFSFFIPPENTFWHTTGLCVDLLFWCS